jgi:hypothetical protein
MVGYSDIKMESEQIKKSTKTGKKLETKEIEK